MLVLSLSYRVGRRETVIHQAHLQCCNVGVLQRLLRDVVFRYRPR